MLAAWLVSTALANSAAPWWWEGQPYLAETVGIETVDIAYEQLVIDASELRTEPRVNFQVLYWLEVSERVETALVFVTGLTQVADVEVTLNGRPVHGTLEAREGEPKGWSLPALGLDEPDEEIVYDVELDPGHHELIVRYSAMPQREVADDPTVLWNVGYVFAPAREWRSFGELDVTVYLPDGHWRVETEPPLQRRGAVLEGSFDGIPADHLMMTLQQPPGRLHAALGIAGPASIVVTLLALPLALVLFGTRAALRASRLGRSPWTVLPMLLGVTAGWYGVWVSAMTFAMASPELGLHPLQSVAEPGFHTVVLAFLGLVAGAGVATAAVAAVQALVVHPVSTGDGTWG